MEGAQRLKDQTMRYSQLRKIPHISDKMVSAQLRELEEHGYILREVFAETPPLTEYSLTDKGRSVIPLIVQIRDFGLQLIAEEGLHEP